MRPTVHYDSIDTAIGPLVLGATDTAVCLLEFTEPNRLEKQLNLLRRSLDAQLVRGRSPLLIRLETQLAEYFAGARKRFELPLEYRGTPFQERVWSALLEISYGDTWSYLQLAKRVGDSGASRAVGTANGMNRIAIIIPCHRVVNSNGALGGYGGGLERKQWLLDLERGQLRLSA